MLLAMDVGNSNTVLGLYRLVAGETRGFAEGIGAMRLRLRASRRWWLIGGLRHRRLGRWTSLGWCCGACLS